MGQEWTSVYPLRAVAEKMNQKASIHVFSVLLAFSIAIQEAFACSHLIDICTINIRIFVKAFQRQHLVKKTIQHSVLTHFRTSYHLKLNDARTMNTVLSKIIGITSDAYVVKLAPLPHIFSAGSER